MILVFSYNISFKIASGTTNSTAIPNIKVQDDDHSSIRYLKANNAKMTEQVNEGDVVTLKAGKSFEKDKDGKLTFLWEQIEPKKPKITLEDTDTLKLKFTAPDVDHSTIFTFKLLVTDSEFRYSDTVRVKVINAVEENKDENSDNNATKPEMNPQLDYENKHQDKTDNSTEQSKSDLILNCDTAKIMVVTGTDTSLKCVVENKSQKIVEVELHCLGLEDTGIDCKIDGEHGSTGTLTLKEMSSETFPVIMSASPHKEPRGSFPFTISAELPS